MLRSNIMGIGIVGMLLVAQAAAADTTAGGEPVEAATVEAVVQAVEARYADVETMRADFVQTTRSDVFGADTQSGTLVLERPAKMRWEFGDDKQFVTDGKTMWVYSKADNQVIRYDDISTQRSSLDSLLSSLHQLDELFAVELVESGETVKLDLTPQDQGQVKEVRLELTEELLVKHVTITDPFGSVTDLEFSNVRLDVEVADSAFTFEPPPGAQVIQAGSF